MTSLPFSNADARPPSNGPLALSASTIRNLPVAPQSGPRFADFQFRTIGQQPELLKRISAPNPDMQYDHDSDLLSPPLPDQFVRTVSPLESDSAKRPSLRDRLSLLESPHNRRDESGDVTMASPPELRPAFDFKATQNVPLIATSTTQAPGLSSPPQNLRTPLSQNRGLRKEPDLQDVLYKEKAIKKAGAASVPNETRFPIITGSQTENWISPSFVQSSTQGNGVYFPILRGTVPSLTALRALQSRLSSSLSNFNPISTANALAAAQSAKDQCTEVLATAHRAHTLAQKASLSAQDSVVAAQECLTIAAAVQSRADLALSAVEKIRSGQEIDTKGESEYNASVKAFKDDFRQLGEWLSQWDAYESKRQLEELENERRRKILTLQLENDLNKISVKKQLQGLISQSEPSMIRIREAMTVEDEADAATRAWNQHREQSVELKRLAEDELRKREVEAELERQKLQAQSEVDARYAEMEKKLQAEKHKAEEEEKSRKEKEALELQRRQQEMEIARFLRSQKQVQDDLAEVAADEKKKAQAAEAEKDLLKRRKMADIEAKREVILERMKRLAMEAQPPVSADTVANISDKAKEQQSTASLTTPPSQHTSLPSSLSSGRIHAEFGNVVSKKTLLTNSPRTMQQDKSLPGTIGLDEHSIATNPTSSISSIPKSSTVMQNGAKSHDSPPDIPSSIDKPFLSDGSTARMPSDHTREVDRRSGDGVFDIGSSRLSSLTSLPPLTPSLSLSPVLDPPGTSSNDFEDIHSDINIHYNGPDSGNVFFVPPSRILPVTMEAQRANLRLFMDEIGITCDPRASGANGRKRSSSRKPLSSSQMNGDQMCRTFSASNPGTEKKVKLEPIHDVVLPTPPAPRIIKTYPAPKSKLPDFKKIKISPPTATQEMPLSSMEPPASAQTISASESLPQPPEPTVTQLNGSALADPSTLSKSKEKGRSAAVRRNVPPLASNGQSPSLEDMMNQAFQGNDLNLPVSPRMGPDAAVTDGWAQPVIDDPLSKGQRKQPAPSLDPSSPYSIVPPVTRLLPPQRPRPGLRIDHYSPPRHIPDKDYSRDRRRSGSTEYSRGGLSPQSKYNDDRRPLMSDNMSPAQAVGRKRYRDDNSEDAPPPRRPRYVSPPFRRDDYVQPSLALRLESEKPWNSHGGSSYRPIYNDSNSFSYESQSRNTKNQRYTSSRSQPNPPQSSSYYDDAQSNQQRQFGRNDVTNDTRLPLLNRFTDLAEQTRGPRSGGNQALEHRISKPKTLPLINRLEDAN